MRRALAVPLLALGLAACGSSSATKPADIAFGRSGGNIAPLRVVVAANGKLGSSKVLSLDRQVRAVFGGLKSRRCPGTLPDVATEYIRFEGRTVRVHGSCEPAFTRLWNRLLAASG